MTNLPAWLPVAGIICCAIGMFLTERDSFSGNPGNRMFWVGIGVIGFGLILIGIVVSTDVPPEMTTATATCTWTNTSTVNMMVCPRTP